MAFLIPVAGVIGAAMAGYGAATIVSAMVYGALIGAAAGALYTAVTGGNILKGALFGAVGGAAIGAGGYLAAGAISAGSFASQGVTVANTVGGGTTTMGSGSLAGVASSGASSFGWGHAIQAATAVSSLGSSFLQGEATESAARASIRAEKEMQANTIASTEKISEANREASALNTDKQLAAQKQLATDDLAFAKEKFSKEFEEAQYQDRATREERERLRQEHEQGITAGSAAIVSNISTLSPVEIQRRRLDLQAPSFVVRGKTQATATSNEEQTGITPGGAATPGIVAA